jgi:conjugal transfer pilus assembly protein TrbC
MKTFPHLAVIACFASAAAFAGAAAQTASSDLDLEAIRARAASQAAEADALAASARARAEKLTDEAKASAARAETHGKRYVSEAAKTKRSPASDSTFDFDKMLANAGSMASENMGQAPRFIAFASTSMPSAALRAMIDDVARAGGVVVFRGLPQNSAKALTAALSKVAKPDRKSTRLNSSHNPASRMPSSA